MWSLFLNNLLISPEETLPKSHDIMRHSNIKPIFCLCIFLLAYKEFARAKT